MIPRLENLSLKNGTHIPKKMPRKNALTYEECEKIEKEIGDLSDNNINNNQLMITSFSQLNLNDKIVKK